MLRFWNGDFYKDEKCRLNETPLVLNERIWEKCKSVFKKHVWRQDGMIDLLPLKDEEGLLLACGFQDSEANRELRMLKELRGNKDALQFTDVFPEYKEVVICGCCELAVSFAEYLRECKVRVSVMGKYWEWFGYKSNYEVRTEPENRLLIYTEGISDYGDLRELVKRSVSPAFECIDKIYEENVLRGNVQDTIGDFDELVRYLEDKREIVILGDDREAQDAYDLLMGRGVDICAFAVKRCNGTKRLLGKEVMGIPDATCRFSSPIFINCKDKHGALGEELTEYFDYCGYERNRQYFLLKDYTDIPVGNLVHVLHQKRVWLTGDRRLCQLLSDYLETVEGGEVTVKYIELGRDVSAGENDILCLVVPDYHNRLKEVGEANKNKLGHLLGEMGFGNYTEYFVCSRCFALIDSYLNQGKEKYGISGLLPRGILLGDIPGWSGNVFFRGVMDGHPEVLVMPYSDLNENLFYYCIRLANMDSDKVLDAFWEMYDEEAGSRDMYFLNKDGFEKSAKRLLGLKESFTSQELFVLFQVAYAEMCGGERMEDVSKRVVYWEPHFASREEFPFFALWLEDERVNGQSIILRRNNVVRTGSACARMMDKWIAPSAYRVMFSDLSGMGESCFPYRHWKEFKMRFEDIKVNPREKLSEVCERLGIKWSDAMMQTTSAGAPLAYRGSVDFDLKAVFNDYEDFLSEFDRFRISIACSPYQKRYGYVYENCLKFSRRELQDLFLKPFRFDEKKIFGRDESEDLNMREWISWQLWNVRKHMVLDDISPEFERFELKQTAKERVAKFNEEKIARMMEYIKSHDKLILYGTGNDCKGMLALMSEDLRKRMLYSDKKAGAHPYVFEGKEVFVPEELCGTYKEYNILVTSSRYGRSIGHEFEAMGISPERVYYNEIGF